LYNFFIYHGKVHVTCTQAIIDSDALVIQIWPELTTSTRDQLNALVEQEYNFQYLQSSGEFLIVSSKVTTVTEITTEVVTDGSQNAVNSLSSVSKKASFGKSASSNVVVIVIIVAFVTIGVVIIIFGVVITAKRKKNSDPDNVKLVPKGNTYNMIPLEYDEEVYN